MKKSNNSYIFSNVKGGCGKTGITFQLAALLSKKGYSVLCIDGDPQHNLSKAFLGNTPDKGLMELLIGECKIEDVIVQPYPDLDRLKNLYLLPCNYELFFFVNKENENKSNTLKNILDKAQLNEKLNYDFIFFDTNPAISLITTSILAYGENIVGVFDASLDSIEGFKFLEERIIKSIQKKANTNLKLFGMVVNNNDSRTNFSTVMLKTLIRLYGDYVFDTTISPSTKNKESRAARLPLVEYEPKHKSALQFNSLAEEFLKRVGEVNE